MHSLSKSGAFVILIFLCGEADAQGAPAARREGEKKETGARVEAPGQRPANSDNTSIVAFSTPLRVETHNAPGSKQPWWQSPVVISAFIAAVGTFANLAIVLFFNAASLRQRELELGTTLKQKTEELRDVLTQKNTELRLTNHQKNIDEERRTLYKQVNEFYGPMQQLLNVSKDITTAFKAGRQFRTLIELLQGSDYVGNDAVLLKEIMAVTARVEDLIMTKSGLVADAELRKLLSRAVSHFRILRLACTGELSGEPERFQSYVFPEELEPRVDEAIARIHTRLEELKQPDPRNTSAM